MITKICPWCKEEFKTYHDRQVCCSISCSRYSLFSDKTKHPRWGKPGVKGEKNNKWKGGIRIVRGYRYILVPDHPFATKQGYVPEHRLIAEKALGKPLHPKHPVHHANEKKADNSRGNLVICEDEAYHRILKKRTDALRFGGNANFLKCPYCKKWGDPKEFYVRQDGNGYHQKCESSYQYERKHKN